MDRKKVAYRVALRSYQDYLDHKYGAWHLGDDPQVLPDMNSQMLSLRDKKPEVREDRKLEPTEYGHADKIPSKVVKNQK